MKVLVTGANGFLGTWLTKKLQEEGHEVSVLVRSTKEKDLYEKQGFRAFLGDITVSESLPSAFQGQQQIFHLAGLIAYRRQDREKMFQVNVQGTENVFTAAAKRSVQRVLLVSSVVAVGARFHPEVLTESSPYGLDKFHLGYHESKRAAEEVVRRFVEAGTVDGVIVNPSTVYGAGDAMKGSRSTQLAVASGRMSSYPSGGVSVVGVEDVVDGMILAMKKGRSGERYILAGENLSLKDVFALIAEAAGCTPPWLPLPGVVLRTLAMVDDLVSKVGLQGPVPSERALVAAMYHWYNSDKARRELGFNPRPAQQAILKSVEWMNEQGLLRK